jgi:hypothetical protein
MTAVAEARRDDIDIGSAMIDVGSRVTIAGSALADASPEFVCHFCAIQL